MNRTEELENLYREKHAQAGDLARETKNDGNSLEAFTEALKRATDASSPEAAKLAAEFKIHLD